MENGEVEEQMQGAEAAACAWTSLLGDGEVGDGGGEQEMTQGLRA